MDFYRYRKFIVLSGIEAEGVVTVLIQYYAFAFQNWLNLLARTWISECWAKDVALCSV